MTTRHLVLTDVDAIQRYVFASTRMAAIVGASHIVRQFDQTLRKLATDLQAQEAVVHGGNGLFVFADDKSAKTFSRRAVREFRRASVNGSLTASGPVAFADPADYPTARQQALKALEKEKRRGTAQDESLSLGLARRCEFCGCEPARPEPRIVGQERQFPGPACAAKLDARAAEAGDAPVRDFNQLAGEDYLAIIVIDGDGLGQRLTMLDSPERHRKFATDVDRVVTEALDAGLEGVGAAGRAGDQPAASPEGFQVLYRGGDDLVLASRAQMAFPFVQAFTASLDAQDWKWAGPAGRIGFSIGVTVAHSGFPFRMAHAIAGELLRNAKRAAKDRDWPEGAIDFAVVTEASGDAESILAERQIFEKRSGEPRIAFTGRPYRLQANQPHSLSKLRQACAELRDFPSGRLFYLRNALTASAWSKTGCEISSELADIKGQIQAFVDQWNARLERIPQLAKSWKRACANLPQQTPLLPYGDLTDALYLWENHLGNHNPIDD